MSIAHWRHDAAVRDRRDDAAFSQGIAALDGAARRAGVFALSGVSSTPAISAAAVAALSTDMGEIVSIDTAILPGNRTPRGMSLVAAILHQAGGKLCLWRDGRWTETIAWSEPRRYALGFDRPRKAFLIGAPDLALFPARFAARTATFRAGMELGVLNNAVSVYAWLRRHNVIAPSNFVIGLALSVSRLFESLGDDRGGMVVRVVGLQSGQPVAREWRLIAEQGEGPFVPGVPVRALLRKADSVAPGARACIRELTLDDLSDATGDLQVSTAVTRVEPLFESVLGSAWSDLSKPVRSLHTNFEPRAFTGKADLSAV